MRILLFVSSKCPHCPVAERVAKRVVPEYYTHGVSFSKIRMKTAEGKELSSRYSISSLPSILILDSTGNEVQRIVGAPSEESLRGEIEKQLGLKKSIFARILGG